MRSLIIGILLIILPINSWAQNFAPPPDSTREQYEYTIIAQRPDGSGAVHASPSMIPMACCSAFTASTVRIHHPLKPAIEATVLITWAADSPDDQVRIWAYSWKKDEKDQWYADGVRTPLISNNAWMTKSPRSNDINVKDIYNSRTTQTFYVLEVQGDPIIYSAKLIVVTEK